MNPKTSAWLLLLFVLFSSCTDSNGPIQTQDIRGAWPAEKAFTFDFSTAEFQSPKNIIFVVRNNDDYPYSNIRFFVEHGAVDAKVKTVDTVNYILAKPNGQWLGKGFGSTKEIEFLYKSSFRFPQKGMYRFRVKQAMRQKNLPGIEDISIKIDNANHTP